MKLFFFLLLLLPHCTINSHVSEFKNWRQVLLDRNYLSDQCPVSRDTCPKTSSFNTSKKSDKNASEKESVKSIDNFDEWTKKRLDAAANQQQKENVIKTEQVVRLEEVVTPSITRPTRNFASKECGAKIISANSEAENAKAVLDEKDIDDYMRNPCEAAKEKFIVIELCETIQVKKIAIGNFEFFASIPKQISVMISERYPPLKEWVSLGTFQLQNQHKKLQTFDVPHTNVYAKFVRINLEDHYGKEHHCIVSVVNVMGSTLADEYEKEEAAVHLLNVLSENGNQNNNMDKVTTPPPAEQQMQTQIPIPPKTRKPKPKHLTIREKYESCSKCSINRPTVSHYICYIWPFKNASRFAVRKPLLKPLTYEQSRRRSLASIQRFLPNIKSNFTQASEAISPVQPIEQPVLQPPNTPVVTEPQVVTPSSPSISTKEEPQIKKESLTYRQELDNILPAGGSLSQRETVLIKLTKRIAAVELNLTLSTEYLSELSKQYVSQMSGYQEELKKTRKVSLESVKAVEYGMRHKFNGIRREMREIRQSIRMLQQMENSRQANFDMSSSHGLFVPTCHMTSVRHPPSPVILPRIGPSDTISSVRLQFEESWKILMERAQSVIFGRITWNTDHMIIALISTNVIAFSCLFAAVFIIHRRNKRNCEEAVETMRNEIRRKLGKYGNVNKRMISKGLRRAELAVTAAVTSTLKMEKNTNNRTAVQELEKALSNLFAAQQSKIDEQFAENKILLQNALQTPPNSHFNDTLSIEDSESSSETENNPPSNL